jgi:hypothetical protein
MRLGVCPVSGKISGNGIDTPTEVGLNLVNPRLKPVNLLTQHLVAFDNYIQFMLKILGHDADMLFEVFRHFSNVMTEKLIDLFDVFCVHGTSAVVKIPRIHCTVAL